MTIQLESLRISIGEKDIAIKDRFTLILGKFKKNLLNQYQNEGYILISENFNLIPIDEFIKIIQKEAKEFSELLKALKLLDILNNFHKKVKINIDIFSKYNDFIQSLIHSFEFNLLLKKKNVLLEELELSKIREKSSELTAISDLIDKLNESLINNKNKLKYLEEDFLKRKNHINQVKKTLNNFNLEIQNLNKQKKECFNLINRITRKMESSKEEKKDDLMLPIEINNNLSNAEKIRALQKKAKEIQYEINENKAKLDEVNLKFEELKPQYEIYEKDYQNLLNIIENDEKKINKLQIEYKEKLKQSEYITNKYIEVKDIKSIRLKNEIEEEIEKLNDKINQISGSNTQINPENLESLSNIIQKLNEFNKNLKLRQKEIIIEYNQDEVYEIFDKFRNLEKIINNLEELLNKFLSQNNLESQLQIVISGDKKFFIQLDFTRSNKEHAKFEELTTPEKVFFIIVLYISIKILTKTNNIIFSNIFIPTQYNKRGSIFRTIKKILPIFQNDQNLSEFRLIFIISNLQMKRAIQNLNLIKINEI
ncbi:MAG: hypothetical protein ACFE9T_03645 [Promethearchaeota archaeon]